MNGGHTRRLFHTFPNVFGTPYLGPGLRVGSACRFEAVRRCLLDGYALRASSGA